MKIKMLQILQKWHLYEEKKKNVKILAQLKLLCNIYNF